MPFIHPKLGISRPDGEHPRRCSKCSQDIPEDAVPLMIAAEIKRETFLFCYCLNPACEQVGFDLLRDQREGARHGL
jgi:hypothetical protein